MPLQPGQFVYRLIHRWNPSKQIQVTIETSQAPNHSVTYLHVQSEIHFICLSKIIKYTFLSCSFGLLSRKHHLLTFLNVHMCHNDDCVQDNYVVAISYFQIITHVWTIQTSMNTQSTVIFPLILLLQVCTQIKNFLYMLNILFHVPGIKKNTVTEICYNFWKQTLC